MTTTRRALLRHTALAAAAGLLPVKSGRLVAQGPAPSLIERLHADLATHAGFGLKFSGSPGDNATADWTAARLRSIGYRVDVT